MCKKLLTVKLFLVTKQFFPSTYLYLLNKFAKHKKVFSNLHRILMLFSNTWKLFYISSFFSSILESVISDLLKH